MKRFVVFIVFLLIFVSLVRNIKTVPYHSDEISWFFHIQFYEKLFLQRDLDQKFWQSYESYDHPQLSKYFFGAYLYAWDRKIFEKRDRLERTYGRWQFYFDPRLSTIQTSEFSPHILRMRQLNVAFTIGTLVLIFLLCQGIIKSMWVSLTVCVLLVFNPLFINTMLRATSDAQMVFFVLASLLWLPSTPILSGLVIGAAMATKLTGIIALYTATITYIFLYKWKQLIFLVIATCSVWYLSNPTLFLSPFAGSGQYISFRLYQSDILKAHFPEVALPTISSKINATFCELFSSTCNKFNGVLTPITFLNILITILGIYVVYRKSKKMFIFICVVYGLNTFILPLYSDRYFILPSVVTYILSALGIAAIKNIVHYKYVPAH